MIASLEEFVRLEAARERERKEQEKEAAKKASELTPPVAASDQAATSAVSQLHSGTSSDKTSSPDSQETLH